MYIKQKENAAKKATEIETGTDVAAHAAETGGALDHGIRSAGLDLVKGVGGGNLPFYSTPSNIFKENLFLYYTSSINLQTESTVYTIQC